MTSTERMPAIFLSHGAPPLADDALWPQQLHTWAQELPHPKAILMLSAHWEARPVTMSSTTGAPLIYDFWGFPDHYYTVQYPAPVAPELAREVTGLLSGLSQPVTDQARGLDHGAYVPLVEMYPEADVPVLQVSLPSLDPQELFAMGQRLAPLRDQGVLIIGSGFTTHNLRMMNPDPAGNPHAALDEFDRWAEEQVAAGDVDSILDMANRAPGPDLAHPRTEHWAPLNAVLGAVAEHHEPQGRTAISGNWHGLSKRSWTFG